MRYGAMVILLCLVLLMALSAIAWAGPPVEGQEVAVHTWCSTLEDERLMLEKFRGESKMTNWTEKLAFIMDRENTCGATWMVIAINQIPLPPYHGRLLEILEEVDVPGPQVCTIGRVVFLDIGQEKFTHYCYTPDEL